MVEVEIKVYIPGGKEMADLEFNEFFENYEYNHCFKLTRDNRIRVKKSIIAKNIDEQDYEVFEIEIPEVEIEPHYDSNYNRYRYRIIYELDDETYAVWFGRDMTGILMERHKQYTPRLIMILADYFREICVDRNNHFKKNIMTGWKHEWRNNGDTMIEYEYQNVDTKSKFMFFQLRDNYINPEKISVLLNLLSESYEITSIFLYGILSVSLKAKRDYYEWNEYLLNHYHYTEKEFKCKSFDPFCLCIYGTNSKPEITKKKIASAFLDYTKNDLTFPNKVCDHLPHSSLGTFDRRIKKICVYADCPIILKPHSNRETIPSNSQKIRQVEKLQLNNIIKGFPVFISKNAIIRDNVFNVDISTIPQFDYETMSMIVENVIFDFIQFIAKEYNAVSDACVPKMVKYAFKSFSRHFYYDRYNTVIAKQCRDLLMAFYYFASYIELYYKEYLPKVEEMMEKQSEYYKYLATDCEIKERTNESNQIAGKNRTNIKKEFYNVILKILDQSPSSIIQKNDEVYIEYSAFQKAYGPGYKSFLKKCRPSIISAPVRPNTNQYRGFTYSKIICGQKTNVLVVKASQYNRYCHKK